MEPKSINLGGILILALFVAGSALLIYKAPCLYDGASGLARDDVAYWHMVKDARVTVLSTAREPRGPRRIFTCSSDSGRIVLAMPAAVSRSRPENLQVGRTYRLDYCRMDGLKVCGILRVHGEVREPAR